jgi:hypothetical protein
MILLNIQFSTIIYLFIYVLTHQPESQLWSNQEQGKKQNTTDAHTQKKDQARQLVSFRQ